METDNLDCIYDSRKSFYGKARVEVEQDCLKGGRIIIKTLFSYNTKVAFIENDKAFILGQWSATTTRHIKEFLKQQGFKVESTKQILKDYLLE